MYETHPTFKIEKSESSSVWRYLDFWKFLNLLETKSLYFSSAENLGDNYEGKIPDKVLNLMLIIDKKNGNNNNKELNEFLNNVLRKETLISSWTYNKESFAMWKMYAKDKMGIAIQTDIESLKKSFNNTERKIYVGEISYFNKRNFSYPTSNMYYPFLVKLEHYDFENEIRCITSCKTNEVKEGKLIEVDLNQLIKTIYISPNSKPEFKKVLELLKNDYSLNFEIKYSEINDSWL